MSDGTDRLQALIRKTDSKNAVDIIKEAIGDPQILVFSELYYSKNVQALKKAGSNPKAIATLELFAFNCYEDYTKNKEKYFELKPEEEKKLKILTFLSLCRESSIVPYDLIVSKLSLSQQQQMEEFVIEVIYNNIIEAHFDDSKRILRVDSFISRDVNDSEIPELIKILEGLSKEVEAVQQNLENKKKIIQEAQSQKVLREEAAKKKDMFPHGFD